MAISSVATAATVTSVTDMNGYGNEQMQATQETKIASQIGSGTESDKQQAVQDITKKTDDKLTKKDLEPMTEAMNKFMELMNADLRFSIHEKTHRVMVQMVDTKTNTVLREFPPHEFLDTMAKISDYVGAILDKKA